MREGYVVRIGTWNLQGRWGAGHVDLINAMDCDLLLLTEVPGAIDLPEHELHWGAKMIASRRWAAVASPSRVTPLSEPHGASVLVEVMGMRVCSSVLPWNGCGSDWPWEGRNTAERAAAAVEAVSGSRPHIWGGDWNHSLSGREWAGAMAGRQTLLDAVEALGLQVPTALLPHRLDGVLSIDHIAVPVAWHVAASDRWDARGLSDHDAYVVDTTPDRAAQAT